MKATLGTGQRFKMLVHALESKTGKSKPIDSTALAAWIGRKKYGKTKFNKMAMKGHQ